MTTQATEAAGAAEAAAFSLRALELKPTVLPGGEYSFYAIIRTEVTIGSAHRVGRAEAPGATLLLLATLEADHEVSRRWPLLPSEVAVTGDIAVPGLISDDEIDWSVTHDGDDVILQGLGSGPVRVPFEHYRQQLRAYAQVYRDFWEEHISQQTYSDWQKQEFEQYWRKFYRLLGEE